MGFYHYHLPTDSDNLLISDELKSSLVSDTYGAYTRYYQEEGSLFFEYTDHNAYRGDGLDSEYFEDFTRYLKIEIDPTSAKPIKIIKDNFSDNRFTNRGLV